MNAYIEGVDRLIDKIMESFVIRGELLTSAEVCAMLNCSRMNLCRIAKERPQIINTSAKGRRRYVYREVVKLLK